MRLKAWSKLSNLGMRVADENDGLTFSLPPESQERYPRGATRVFIAGPMKLDDRFYTRVRVNALTSLLLGR